MTREALGRLAAALLAACGSALGAFGALMTLFERERQRAKSASNASQERERQRAKSASNASHV